ncbi:hypothetical protein CDL15_Pgr004921 [Punica granatum]|uniref:Uncharacterized protein n=1 Tax=Punica granatum TaxID=22663 RepID=A0A218XR51_PUNGR|nr:hypothetical protein CDL15_Pgr004921 [Punica granatum]
MNKTVTLGSRILRGPGIPKENGQVIYSNTIPDRLYYRTQPSKADSSSSTAGEEARLKIPRRAVVAKGEFIPFRLRGMAPRRVTVAKGE